jgi:hypothetical protein
MAYEPQTREALDEALVAGRDFARVTRGQFEAFVEAGFNEPQALRLTAAWMAAYIAQGGEP